MKRILLPGTDLSVSRLSFGTASIHHLFKSSERQKLLSVAYETGFTHFDTSPYYGLGIAEQELGHFIQRQSITIATKIGLYPRISFPPSAISVYAQKALGKILPNLSLPQVDWSLKRCEHSLHLSLRRMRIDRIDILFLHEPFSDLLPADELYNWLYQKRQEGKIRYWGLAGALSKYASLVEQKHPLSQIVQMQDSIRDKQSISLKSIERVPQFTYGYMSSKDRSQSLSDILREACTLNFTGSILVSTRQVHHITEYIKYINSIESEGH